VKEPSGKKWGCIVAFIAALIIGGLLTLMVVGFFVLSLIGAGGQPSTIIPPSTEVSGNAVPIPTNLNASAAEDKVTLNWSGVQTADLKSYKIYKSLTPGKKYSVAGTIPAGTTIYTDSDVKKGISYYYIATALTANGAESGNSTETSAIIEAEPLIPEGIYSWADVKKKIDADAKYLELLTKVTKLTKADVEQLVAKEKSGAVLKKTLLEGTIITNSTKDYRLLPNYILKTDRIALTDENGTPYVLTKCGNPMKIQINVSGVATIVKKVQVFVTNIIMVFPPSVTNIFINAGQPANSIAVTISPSFIEDIMGPSVVEPAPEIFIDPADLGADYVYSPEALVAAEASKPLEEGQQWIESGKLRVEVNPPQPAPGQSVSVTIRLFSVNKGVEIEYSVKGSDGYKKSGKEKTDDKGEIHFTVPGGKAGVQDDISANVPSENIKGTATYHF